MAPDWSSAWLVLRVAALAALLSLAPALWVARLMGRSPSRVAAILANASLALPPAIVCGYFLFRFAGRPFSWPYAAVAAMLNAVPVLLRAATLAFGSLDERYENSARSLGVSEFRVFSRIALPLTYRPILIATAIVFARILTEYGAVLIIAKRLAS